MIKLIVATSNPGKLREMQEYLTDLPWELSLKPEDLDITETGNSFIENACLKASEIAKVLEQWAIADNSGLAVEAINNVNTMKVEALKKRLDKNRPMTTITIRIPEDVMEDLKRVAPMLGFSSYQPLVRAYIGQGLRSDLERLEGDTVSALIASLKRRGVSDEVINEALNEVTQH